MFDVDFKLKNETDFTIKVFTMIEGEYAPAVMILKPNEEMLHFKPSIGIISISVMAERSDEIEQLKDEVKQLSKERNRYKRVCLKIVGDSKEESDISDFVLYLAEEALKESE